MSRRRPPWALLVVPLLLAGCGSSPAASSAGPSGTAGSESMAAMTHPAGVPPETATMVCGDDISSKVVQVLQLAKRPQTRSTWARSVYTCTYALPMGPMVLSVQVAPSHAAAVTSFEADRTRRGTTETLDGLGERAFGSATGVAVVLKDDEVLTVDTTALPVQFGANGQRRTDLANEIASDVLGCWTGDE
ncbi:MAG: hypothetical protein ACXVYC_16660 [Blastococcus sp.]